MLGRRVAEELATAPPTSLVAPEVAAECRRADLFVLNLECCISERGRPWSDPAKPFFFRAPPVAVETLAHLGADCVIAAVGSVEADAVLVTPHWGQNMTSEPVPHVRRAAQALVDAGAALVAGHSAHVFHGVQDGVLFDLGDFLDDYAVDAPLRNDLGLLWFVELDERGPRRLEAG